MKNLFDLSHSQILVTGATSGIGLATVKLLDELGAKLILVGRKPETLEHTLKQLKGNHVSFPIDLSQFETIPDKIKHLTQEIGLLHGLVHCAGIQMMQPLRWQKASEVSTIIDVNVNASIAIAKAFTQKGVYNTEGASLVLLSSVVGVVGQAGISAYAASKGAIMALTKSLAIELADNKIRVNCVAPGVVETPMSLNMFSRMTDHQVEAVKKMHLLGLGAPEDIANAITFLLADTSRWITGTTLFVDGGYTAH